MPFTDYIIPILLFLGLIPFGMGGLNRERFRAPRKLRESDEELLPVSVLIPARNEEQNIGQAVESCLESHNVEIEVIVLDDQSEDNTRLIVEDIARNDDRVSVHSSEALPEGWSGKQYACYQLSKLAKHDFFLFLDADVAVKPDCIARVAAEARRLEKPLMSGFPRQITKTWLEWMVLPLIHFILLGYLPFRRMRRSLSPAASAGCGQFFFTTRDAYEKTGGHSAIKASSHDGVQLPRAYRRAGFATDICDITHLAQVRMYHSAGEVWQGLAKNATEGIGNPRTIVPMTILLLAQVIPFPMMVFLAITGANPTTIYLLTLVCLLNFANRLLLSIPYRLPASSCAAHPLGVAILLVIQWQALLKKLFGLKTNWKGRQV